MTISPRLPAFWNAPTERCARVHRATQALHAMGFALAADCALLDTPPAQSSTGWTETGGVYSLSYVRNPGARFVRLEARVTPVAAGATLTLSLTIRDAAGHSVGPGDDRIPYDWRGETLSSPIVPFAGTLPDASQPVLGVVDCDALASTLTDESWSFDVTLTVSGGAQLDGVTLYELPRFIVDDSATHGGIVPGSFQRDAVIHDGATDGLVRLVSTLESARLSQRSYLNLSWRQSLVAADTPSCSSTTLAPFTLLDAGAAAASFRVIARVINAASAAGEPIRWRVLYRMSDGTTETGTVKLLGSATGSPWTTGALAYTTSWTWSAWKSAAVRTSPAYDAFSLKGQVSGSGPTLWLAGIDVREAITPL